MSIWVVLTGLASVLILAVIVSAILNPVLRRIAIRNVIRWPASSALVIAGSMVGTAMIAGSLVVYETTRDGSHALIERHLGEIDLIATLPDPQGSGNALFDETLTERASVENINNELDRAGSDVWVNGMLPVIHERIAAQSVHGETGELMRVAPRISTIALDWDQLAEFGDNPPAIPQPEPGGIIASDELAESLDLTAGDRVELFVGDEPISFTVDEIVPTAGIAGVREVVFNPDRGTALINLEEGQQLFAQDVPSVNTMFVSISGAITESFQHAPDVQAALAELLRGADTRGTFLALSVKDEYMEPTEFGVVFVVFSSFVILTGILLLVNIYVMLAEERRGTLGIIRALGMRRGHLVRLFMYEGLIYSVFAAALGVLAGLAMARISVASINQILREEGVESFVFAFAPAPETLIFSGLAGILLACVTVLITSLRTSRINIVLAMRGLEQQELRTRSWWSVIWPILAVLAGGAITALAAATDSGAAWLIGPTIALIGAGSALRPLINARLVVSLALAGCIAYVWAGIQLIPAVQDELSEGAAPIIIFSLILMFSAIGLVALNLSLILAPVRWIFSRLRAVVPTVRMALAYPSARPIRTSLTIMMFTVVVFMLTFGQVMIANVEHNFLDPEIMEETELGGFSALVTVNPANPITDFTIGIESASDSQFESIQQISELRSVQMNLPGYRQGDFIGPGDRSTADLDAPLREQLIGVDDVFLQNAGTRLALRSPEYESDEEVWQAMADDPGLIVGSDRYLGGQHWSRNRPRIELGETLLLEHPVSGEVHEKRMIGIFREQMMPLSPINGILFNNEALLSGPASSEQSPDWYLVGLDPEVNHRAVADALEREFVSHGVWVEVIRDWLGLPFWLRLFHVIGTFLVVGLFVGIAGLAIVSTRAVHQRKRDIGTLRAFGFRRGMITACFLSEAMLVAIIGIAVGVGCGLLAGYGFYLDEVSDYPNASFYIPTSGLVRIAVAILFAAAVFTILPAVRASRLSVVDSLRPRE